METRTQISPKIQLLGSIAIYAIFVVVTLILKPADDAPATRHFIAAAGGFVLGAALAYCSWQLGNGFLRNTKIKVGGLKPAGKIAQTILFALLLLLLIIIAARNLPAVFSAAPLVAANTALFASTAALFEETLVRGLMLCAFLQLWARSKNRILLAALASSILFGLMHLANLAFAPPTAVVQQVFYAAVFGLVFSALYVRTQKLIFPIAAHFLVDFQPAISSGISPSQAQWWQTLIAFVPIALAALITLWHYDQSD
ncbi:membrane protease YdiL (CAAX protease family) [Trueperella bonasi]|uniref:Membrane protease YdiL (CAAX protease family) n=1 Tax=Trueperella bonasi TaxID=312286 RepID=A0ABT9NEB5_9ACTO|nr:CPBP family intramembrane glutamic endopeptidase [Trueperella bonasi]MDP9805734.1 membrane protease YdiL (CAAX protease family) [Trueperella bonasi]